MQRLIVGLHVEIPRRSLKPQKRLPGGFEKPLALPGQTHLGIASIEQIGPEIVFELLDLTGHRARRDAEFSRCPAEISFSSSGFESPDRVQRR